MWSSTHLDKGAMPWERMICALAPPHEAVNASTRGQPKAIPGVNSKLVITMQANDKTRQLFWLDWDGSVSLLDVAYCSLGTRGQA